MYRPFESTGLSSSLVNLDVFLKSWVLIIKEIYYESSGEYWTIILNAQILSAFVFLLPQDSPQIASFD